MAGVTCSCSCSFSPPPNTVQRDLRQPCTFRGFSSAMETITCGSGKPAGRSYYTLSLAPRAEIKHHCTEQHPSTPVLKKQVSKVVRRATGRAVVPLLPWVGFFGCQLLLWAVGFSLGLTPREFSVDGHSGFRPHVGILCIFWNIWRKARVLPFARFHAAAVKCKELLPLLALAAEQHLASPASVYSSIGREKEQTDLECLQLWSAFLDRSLSGLCRKIGPSFVFDLSSSTRKRGRS